MQQSVGQVLWFSFPSHVPSPHIEFIVYVIVVFVSFGVIVFVVVVSSYLYWKYWLFGVFSVCGDVLVSVVHVSPLHDGSSQLLTEGFSSNTPLL